MIAECHPTPSFLGSTVVQSLLHKKPKDSLISEDAPGVASLTETPSVRLVFCLFQPHDYSFTCIFDGLWGEECSLVSSFDYAVTCDFFVILLLYCFFF